MTTEFSKVTTKARTVIPRAVRARLGLKVGDCLLYRITPEGVLIEKAQTESNGPFATFTEWDSKADERAYKTL